MTYLNQATANATGRPVLAGPVEATGLGNLLVQAVACGITPFQDGRQKIAESFPMRRFEPIDRAAWKSAARQVRSSRAVVTAARMVYYAPPRMAETKPRLYKTETSSRDASASLIRPAMETWCCEPSRTGKRTSSRSR